MRWEWPVISFLATPAVGDVLLTMPISCPSARFGMVEGPSPSNRSFLGRNASFTATFSALRQQLFLGSPAKT